MRSPRRRLRALRTLGRALVAPEDAPARDDPSWRDIKAAAREHGLLGALHGALPGDDEVIAAHRSTLGRNLVARRQLRDVIAAFHDAHVDVLLFKGSQYLCDGTVTDLGSRSMADIDLAVPDDQVATASEVLLQLGYTAAPVRPFEFPHETPFVGPPGAVLPIELHVDLGSPPIPDVVPTDRAWAGAVPVDVDGVTVRALSIEDALVHHVLHAQVQDLNHAVAGLPVRQLHTFALLARRDDLPWGAVRDRLDDAGFGAAWRAYAALAKWVFGVDVPVPGSDGRRAQVDRALALASFAAGEWPSDVLRNLRFALGADYLDATYDLGGDRRRLPAARARHLWLTARSSGRDVITAALRPRR